MSEADHSLKHPAGNQETESADLRLLRLKRLENIGLFATRVAHDLNNMLGPMRMSIPMLRPSITDPTARNLLDSLETTIGRATGLVRQILEYADGIGGQLQLLPMQELVEEIATFATETFPQNIKIEKHIPLDLWPINANPSQIHQVLLNLCVNARDAMPHGGTLSLRAENCTLDTFTAAKIDGASPGSFLVLQIEDTGTGFSPTVMARIWEPFLTTKKAGRGSGLGLSTIREIVTHHNGFIQLRTKPGKGSSFRVYLPAHGIVAPAISVAASVREQSALVSKYPARRD